MKLIRDVLENVKWSGIRSNFLLNMNDPRNLERYSGIDMMRREQVRHITYYKLRIHPHSRFRVLWETFYSVFTVFNVLSAYALLCISFLFVLEETKFFLIGPWGDIVLATNIILNFITGTFDEVKKEADMSFFMIWKHYLSTYMLVFDLIGLLWGSQFMFDFVNNSDDDILFLSIALAILCRIFSPWYYWRNRIREYFLMDGIISQLIELNIFLIPIFAFLACVVFALRYANPISDSSRYTSWSVLTGYLDEILRVTSGYSSLTIWLNPLVIISHIIIMILPYIRICLMTCFLILICLSRKSSEARYCDLIDNFYSYLKGVNISERLRIRIGRYYEESYGGKFFSEPYIIEKISSELREDILAFKLSRLRQQITVFRMIPLKELLVISQRLVCEVYFTNDVIAYSGSPHDRMYFIARGAIAVYTNNAYEAYHVPNSMYILIASIRPELLVIKFNYLACETTILYSLSRGDFLAVMKECPVLTELLWFAHDNLVSVNEYINDKDSEINGMR